MQVVINGHPHDLKEEPTVLEIVAKLGWQPSLVAVAVNRSFLPRNHWTDRRLHDGEEIEVVSPMQGG